MIAALFDMADKEFVQIRDETLLLERQAEKYVEPVGGKAATIFDVFAFWRLVHDKFGDFKFESYKVDGFVQDILTLKPDLTDDQFEEALIDNLKDAIDFKEHQQKVIGRTLNPYSLIRVALYLWDSDVFLNMLFDYVRDDLVKWRSEK